MKVISHKALIGWGTLALALLTAGSMVGAGFAYLVRMDGTVSSSRANAADHETRLRVIEVASAETRADVREIRTDVRWIRESLDRHDPAKGLSVLAPSR